MFEPHDLDMTITISKRDFLEKAARVCAHFDDSARAMDSDAHMSFALMMLSATLMADLTATLFDKEDE